MGDLVKHFNVPTSAGDMAILGRKVLEELKRQQAEAVLSARRLIVKGAVGMVESALADLNERGVVDLDEDRKAAMVSNLLVVLCADREAQPVVNTGTLYG